MVNVKSVNDIPKFIDFPESISFDTDSTTRIILWDFIEDVETPDSMLSFMFTSSNDSLVAVFDSTTGELTLSAHSGYTGDAVLNIKVSDDSNATVEMDLLVNVSSVTGLEDLFSGIPKEYVLMQNYPNPFNPVTSIRYGLPKPSLVRLEIYNVLGQRVKTLVNEYQKAGYYLISFNAQNFASGLYIYHLQTEQFQAIKKMIFVK